MAENPGADRFNMQNLQQEAIRRAREMQARAQIPPSYTPPRPVEGAPHTHAEQMPVHAPKPENRHAPPPRPPDPPPLSGSLDFLMKDSERTLILALLLILMEERADSSLVFALTYLLI